MSLPISQRRGDTDASVPFVGTERCVSALRLNVKSPWAPWIVDEQVAGYRVQYEGLTFATVRGAGHMVPQWRQKEAYVLVKSFLDNETH